MRFPSNPRTASMPGHVLVQLLESNLLSAAEVDRFRTLMTREGIEPTALLAAGAQAPMRWFREACEDLDADRAACLGYFAGEQARLTSYSVLSLPLVSAGSVSEVLQLLNYMPLISNVLKAEFLEREDAIAIRLSVDSGDPVLDRIPLLYCAAAVVHLLRILSGETPELTLHVAWPAPAALAAHPECLAGRLRFNAPMHFIAVPRETLASVCRFSDPIAYQGAITGLDAMSLALVQPEDIIARVRQRIEHDVGSAQLATVAADLHVSASTLKRRLADAGTRFSDILAATQRDRAMLMLSDASMSLDAVALALCYSDLANFSHAFKRWTGWAPGEFRRRLAGGL